jgi:hypothetical protein
MSGRQSNDNICEIIVENLWELLFYVNMINDFSSLLELSVYCKISLQKIAIVSVFNRQTPTMWLKITRIFSKKKNICQTKFSICKKISLEQYESIV